MRGIRPTFPVRRISSPSSSTPCAVSTAAGRCRRPAPRRSRPRGRSSTRSCAAADGFRWCWSRPIAVDACRPTSWASAAGWWDSPTWSCWSTRPRSRRPRESSGSGARGRARWGAAAVARLAIERRPVASSAVAGRGGRRAPTGRAPRVAESLRTLVEDAAALRIDDDPEVAKLARAGSAQELAQRRAELARLRACGDRRPRGRARARRRVPA